MRNLKDINWEELLSGIQNPGRYTGSEYNGYRKGEKKQGFLLVFPDDYKIGMSSLGYHIVGEIVRQDPNFYVERAFAPAEDMEALMREKNIELFSLESKTPAADFDIIGFSFHYELAYTNYINMMDLAGLEPFRKDRKKSDPLIIGGGPVCVNPEILSEFMDAVIVGEAEEVLPGLLAEYSPGRDKEKFLEKISLIGGVYVPGKTESVEKAFCKTLDTKYHPVYQPVPVVDIVHNRLNIEINRGCRHRCRFCQATNIYAPYRQRSVSQIRELAIASVAATGFDEISLTSLSASGHPELCSILDELHFSLRDLGVSAVLSSMRPETFSPAVAGRLKRLKSGGLTFAPETSSARMKKVIGKNVKNEEIIKVVSK
ncbi:MAG: radical SAM protein, partial [Elusimicrobiota bacterium]|nr:radical SAM protein [Elusimicrobiota bacterium]